MIFDHNEKGQGLVEFALILVLVIVVLVVIIALLGPAAQAYVSDFFSTVTAP